MIRVLLLLISAPFCLSAQVLSVSGTVRDASGDRLPAAHIQLFPDSLKTTTTENGQFVLRTERGNKLLVVSFVGYQRRSVAFNLQRDTVLSLILHAETDQLHEVVITAERDRQQELFESNQTSKHILTQENIKSLPVLGGEADVIKALQLLPGTVRGVEGSSDVFVRGGAADQNLVLLDGVPIYNSSHLFGFLSVFNPDMVDAVESINGGFPAEYGGRLSSVLNVRTRNVIPDKTSISADIGVIASRFFIEQPIVQEKASIWFAARRTYIDQVVKVFNQELPYYFYDLNGKIILRPTKQDEISITYFSGEDILDLFRDRNGDGDGFLTRFESGNNSQSVDWRRQLNTNVSSAITLLRSRYQYSIQNSFEENALVALSDIEDYGAQFTLQADSVLGNGTFKTGVSWTRHAVSPNVINTEGSISQLLESSTADGQIANEMAVFFQYDGFLSDRLQFSAGLRTSMAVVPGQHYLNPEPRFSLRYDLNETRALKFSYSRMVQYLHRISNSAVSSPTDIWYPVTSTIRPQSSHQVALALQEHIPDRSVLMSMEAYYKAMDNLIGFEEGTNLFLNNEFASKLIQGKGNAYGVEFLIRKDAGKFTGWLSYTLSWSWRQFAEVNSGKWFPSRYDRRHNGAVVMQYAFSNRLSASVVWEFISGARFTPVIGQYVLLAPTLTGFDLIPVYADINDVKLADTHRLDVGIKWRSRAAKRFQWHWFAGVYNSYNRANPIGISIEQSDDGSLQYEQPGLFGLLPFISYGFKL